jgi:HAD superfamily hydrolase (TIGR01509 family)
MARAALFDLDGTLQDSEVLWVAATRAFLEERGASISQEEATRLVYGRSWRDVYAGLARLAPVAARGMSRTADELRPYFLRLRAVSDIRIPGSLALLRRLAARMPVAVVSGATRHDVAESVAQLGIENLLRFYLGAEDYGSGKPHPDCYLMAARRLAIPPADCLVFEDSEAGVRAAKSAGMRCVALRRHGAPPQTLEPADLVVADLSDFDPDSLTPRTPTGAPDAP